MDKHQINLLKNIVAYYDITATDNTSNIIISLSAAERDALDALLEEYDNARRQRALDKLVKRFGHEDENVKVFAAMVDCKTLFEDTDRLEELAEAILKGQFS